MVQKVMSYTCNLDILKVVVVYDDIFSIWTHVDVHCPPTKNHALSFFIQWIFLMNLGTYCPFDSWLFVYPLSPCKTLAWKDLGLTPIKSPIALKLWVTSIITMLINHISKVQIINGKGTLHLLPSFFHIFNYVVNSFIHLGMYTL
jgi:hypothetical protein